MSENGQVKRALLDNTNDEDQWCTFASHALAALVTRPHTFFEDDVTRATEYADVMMRELRSRRTKRRTERAT